MIDMSVGREGRHVSEHRHVGWAARGPHALIKVYQWALAGRPSPCRYVPSCSNYALEALEVHGLWRGLWLGARRVLRCNPWGGHGWDPVPGCERAHQP